MSARCPHPGLFEIEGESFTPEEIIETLAGYVTEERRKRIQHVIANRTYTVAPVMEGLYDRGNVSAVLRSAEALGYQSVHIIETSSKFKKAKRVTQGAEKWLDVESWPSTASCVAALRDKGYRIIATHLSDARSIREIDCLKPFALVFGNEKDGVSDELLELADDRVVLPTEGFSRSLNISVAAALCLYHIAEERRRQGGHGDLNFEEKTVLTASFYLRSANAGAQIVLEKRRCSPLKPASKQET